MEKELLEGEQTTMFTEEENNKERLAQLCGEMKKLRDETNMKTKMLDKLKKEFRELAEKLGIKEFESPEARVTITEVDKSYLDEKPTLEYLHSKGLEEFIHTKEFFDYAELGMGVTQNKIVGADLNQFLIKKIETRLNIN